MQETTAQRVKSFYAANSPEFLEDAADIRSGAADLSIHRHLHDPQSGTYSPDIVNADILAFLQKRLAGITHPAVLDAGCGWGGTLKHLAESMPIQGTGITLCPVQADRACRALAGADIAIIEGDFCRDAPEGPFDAIIAVESIAHTASYPASLHALARHLAPGGVIVVVDDFTSATTPPDADLLAMFRAGWIVEAVDSVERIEAALDGLALDIVTDYTPRVFRRSPEECAALLHGHTPQSLAREADDRERARLGGVALEQLYNRGEMRYLMLALTRPAP